MLVYRCLGQEANKWYTNLDNACRKRKKGDYVVKAEVEGFQIERVGKDNSVFLKEDAKIPVVSVLSSDESKGKSGMIHIQTLKSIISDKLKYKRRPSGVGEVVLLETGTGSIVPVATILVSLARAGKKIQATREPLADVVLLFDGEEWTEQGEELLRQAFENAGLQELDPDQIK